MPNSFWALGVLGHQFNVSLPCDFVATKTRRLLNVHPTSMNYSNARLRELGACGIINLMLKQVDQQNFGLKSLVEPKQLGAQPEPKIADPVSFPTASKAITQTYAGDRNGELPPSITE